jgi:hypothetical protein
VWRLDFETISVHLEKEGASAEIGPESLRCREVFATCAPCSRIRTQHQVLQIEVGRLLDQSVSNSSLSCKPQLRV